MKHLRLFSTISLLVAIATLNAQDLDKILADHFKAAGQEKTAKVETNIIKGKTIVSSMGMEMPFTLIQARPDKIRIESSFQDSKMIQTFNGETGWTVAPMLGIVEPAEITGNDLQMLKTQADMDGALWDYEAKGNKIEVLEEEVVNDSPAYHLKITTSDGDVSHNFIDKKSNLLVKITMVQAIGGSESEVENLLSDYKMIKGMAVPHTITTKMNGQTLTQVIIESVEFNKKVDQNLFGKPAL